MSDAEMLEDNGSLDDEEGEDRGLPIERWGGLDGLTYNHGRPSLSTICSAHCVVILLYMPFTHATGVVNKSYSVPSCCSPSLVSLQLLRPDAGFRTRRASDHGCSDEGKD